MSRPTLFCSVWLLASITIAACGGSDTEPPTTSLSGLPCAVSTVLERRCSTCHGEKPQFGAPMALVTHADLTRASVSAPQKHVFEMVSARIHDGARPMPPPPNVRLDDADLRALDAWIAQGAPKVAEACTPPGGGSVVTTRLRCTKNEHLRPSVPYRMPREVDDELVCYGWDSPHGEKRHIIGLSPAIAATRQLHHVTLLQSERAVSSVPGPCEPNAMSAWRPLYGWAPGAASLELPKEAGLALEPGGHYVVQLHFTNPLHEEVTDTSGFDLCSTKELRPNDADVMAFGTTEITIPALGTLDRDCSVVVPADGATTHLIAAFPHMHRLGRSIHTQVFPGGTGAPVNLGSVETWDLGNQTWQATDYTLRPGDVVQSQCRWSNPTGNAVGYGPTADDEMCFSYVLYYPKIIDATWNWSLPALYSTCNK
ncbi:MAG: peptidylglycine alpha-amidating monooxygenase [Polyangiaceae bacterium]